MKNKDHILSYKYITTLMLCSVKSLQLVFLTNVFKHKFDYHQIKIRSRIKD